VGVSSFVLFVGIVVWVLLLVGFTNFVVLVGFGCFVGFGWCLRC
jgi:hypothetical protein